MSQIGYFRGENQKIYVSCHHLETGCNSVYTFITRPEAGAPAQHLNPELNTRSQAADSRTCQKSAASPATGPEKYPKGAGAHLRLHF